MNNKNTIIGLMAALVIAICQPVTLAQTTGPGYELVPDAILLSPNDQLTITVLFDEPSEAIAGYQIDMIESGGDTGSFDIVSIGAASTPECDFIYASDNPIVAAVPIITTIGVIHSIGEAQVITGQKCAAVFVYQASADASGIFTFDLHPINSFLLNALTVIIPLGTGDAIQVGVGVDCFVDTDCDDGNECTDDTCVSNVCVYTNDDTNLCNVGNLCATNSTCVAGTCSGTNKPTGTMCNDGLTCTGSDVCDGNGVCVHSGSPCAANESCNECPRRQFCCYTAFPCACTMGS